MGEQKGGYRKGRRVATTKVVENVLRSSEQLDSTDTLMHCTEASDSTASLNPMCEKRWSISCGLTTQRIALRSNCCPKRRPGSFALTIRVLELNSVAQCKFIEYVVEMTFDRRFADRE